MASSISQDRFFGVSAGGALYTGDLDPISNLDYIQNVNFAFGVFYRQELSDRLSFKLNLSRLRISAADNINIDLLLDPSSSPERINSAIPRVERNFDIQNRITEFSFLLETGHLSS